MEGSVSYSQGRDDVKADAGRRGDVVAALWTFSTDYFNFVGEEGKKVINRAGKGYGRKELGVWCKAVIWDSERVKGLEE